MKKFCVVVHVRKVALNHRMLTVCIIKSLLPLAELGIHLIMVSASLCPPVQSWLRFCFG